MATLKWRDVRLKGWKPRGNVIESNFDTPLSWMINRIKHHGNINKGDLTVKIYCHGLPGFLKCCNGSMPHPQAGNGITVKDVKSFEAVRGYVKKIEFHSCLIARIGACAETGNLTAYDGNEFCFKMAKAIQAKVKASIHLQWFIDGTYTDGKPTGKGIDFGHWNGRVFTWNHEGRIIKTEDFPYTEKT